MFPGSTRITGGVLPPRYRNSDFPEAGSDAATSLTGVVVCGSSGNDRSCPFAATAISPMLVTHPHIVPGTRLGNVFLICGRPTVGFDLRKAANRDKSRPVSWCHHR